MPLKFVSRFLLLATSPAAWTPPETVLWNPSNCCCSRLSFFLLGSGQGKVCSAVLGVSHRDGGWTIALRKLQPSSYLKRSNSSNDKSSLGRNNFRFDILLIYSMSKFPKILLIVTTIISKMLKYRLFYNYIVQIYMYL